MEDNKQLVNVGGLIKRSDNPAVAMKTLAEEVGRLLKSDLPEKGNLLKLFEAGFLYLMDKYFAEAGIKLYDWMDAPLPEVAENEGLKKIREKLKRKEKRMRKKPYKEKFIFTWHKEWDIDKKIPMRELDTEAYYREIDKVEHQIREVERTEERDKENRRAEIMNTKLEELLSAALGGFEASDKIHNSVVSYILQTVNLEYFILLARRICSFLEADIKKNNGWTEKSAVLGRFVLSLKQRIKNIPSGWTQDASALKRLTTLRDIALEAELFITEINNSITAQRKQEQFQGELQRVLESGFKQMDTRLGFIESGIVATNRQLSGINGRLADVLKINGEILDGIIQNGQLIGSLSGKLDGISEQLSGIGEMMLGLVMGDKK